MITWWAFQGPGNGTARFLANGTLAVSIEYSYRLVPNYKSTMNCEWGIVFLEWEKFLFSVMQQIVYLDNQRAVLYWCFRRDTNGTCIQANFSLFIRVSWSKKICSMMLMCWFAQDSFRIMTSPWFNHICSKPVWKMRIFAGLTCIVRGSNYLICVIYKYIFTFSSLWIWHVRLHSIATRHGHVVSFGGELLWYCMFHSSY